LSIFREKNLTGIEPVIFWLVVERLT